MPQKCYDSYEDYYLCRSTINEYRAEYTVKQVEEAIPLIVEGVSVNLLLMFSIVFLVWGFYKVISHKDSDY